MSRVPNQVLERIACEITEHTKQLGLFDDLRMKLLDSIQTSKDFLRLRGEFKRELDSFCTRADLSLARAKLRERLTEKTLYKSAGKLRELVEQQVSSRQQRHVIRQMYTQQALEFLRNSKKSTTSSRQAKDSQKLEVDEEEEEELIEAGPPSASSSSSVESFADSGLGSSGGTSSSPSPSVNRISKSISKRNSFDSLKNKNSEPRLKLESELEYKHESSFSSRLTAVSLMPLTPQTHKPKKSKDKTKHKCSQLSNRHCDSSIKSDLAGKQQFQRNHQTEQAHSRKRSKYHSTSSRSSHSSSSSFLKISSVDSATNHSIKRA